MAKTKVATKVKRPAAARAAGPVLALEADRLEVRTGDSIRVAVALKGVDEVLFSLEPGRRVFSLDLASMTKPGALRLRGEGHGVATLVASGRKGGAEVVRRVIHVRCQGPRVGILVFGYIRGGN